MTAIRIEYLDELLARETALATEDRQPTGRFSWSTRGTQRLESRSELVSKYAWAIPNAEAIAAIVAFAPRIVEIGAGSGYWAMLLRQAGADVLAYDKHLPTSQGGWDFTRSYVDVQIADHRIAAKHPDRALFLCWPPYDDLMAANALDHYAGNQLIYIGEGMGGCTADDQFWRKLDEWEEQETIYIPCYDGLHDCLGFYLRKEIYK